MAEFSPMMQRYLETKEEYKDCILFYRLGDFYEMFFEDAITASRELELTLTGKDCGQEERAPMCGIPHHIYCDVLSVYPFLPENNMDHDVCSAVLCTEAAVSASCSGRHDRWTYGDRTDGIRCNILLFLNGCGRLSEGTGEINRSGKYA